MVAAIPEADDWTTPHGTKREPGNEDNDGADYNRRIADRTGCARSRREPPRMAIADRWVVIRGSAYNMLTGVRCGSSVDRRLAVGMTLAAATLLAASCFAVSDVLSDRPRSWTADLSPRLGQAVADRSGRPVLGRIILTQIPAKQRNKEPQHPGVRAWRNGLPHGSRIVVFDRYALDAGFINLTPEFAAAGRPDVSFDGKRILFVGRRAPRDPTSVWEMQPDGSGVREVVRPAGDCEAAIYLSTMFTLNAERPLYQIAFVARGPKGAHSSLYTCLMDGSNVRRVTFTPHGVSDPLLLSDGRLLFGTASGDVTGSGSGEAPRSTAMLTINMDGTDVFPFAGLHEPPARRSAPCETDDGQVVYVESGHAGDGGSLVSVARTRSLKTRRLITTNSDGEYHTPSALPNGNLLVSFRPSDDSTDRTYGLYELDPATGKRVAEVCDDPDWNELGAVVVRARPEPPGRSTVVSNTGDTGQLYCMDAYISDLREGRERQRGLIARVRVIAHAPGRDLPSSEGESATGYHDHPADLEAYTRVLGEASVESDGSFFLDVPARTPLRLETLDKSGRVLDSMRSWIWVMPVERRGCIGCHEDRELTPPNRHVLALRKAPQPIGVEPPKPRNKHHGGYQPKEP